LVLDACGLFSHNQCYNVFCLSYIGQVTNHFRKIKRAVKKLPGAETDTIWPSLKNLSEDRNLIAHGFWALNNDGRPVVLSYKFLKSDDYVTAQFFDYTRFEYFQTRAEHLLNTFRVFKTMLDSMSKEDRVVAGFTLPTKLRHTTCSLALARPFLVSHPLFASLGFSSRFSFWGRSLRQPWRGHSLSAVRRGM
jgi:hypothetical protein